MAISLLFSICVFHPFPSKSDWKNSLQLKIFWLISKWHFRCSTKVNDAGNHEVGGEYWGYCSESCIKQDQAPEIAQLHPGTISDGKIYLTRTEIES